MFGLPSQIVVPGYQYIYGASPSDASQFVIDPSTVIWLPPKVVQGYGSTTRSESSAATTVMPKPKRQSTPKWSLHPTLHDDVAQLLEEDGLFYTFHPIDDQKSCLQAYDTNIMGRFRCTKCSSRSWSSKRIAITIRHYRGGRYNARVYHQRCTACSSLGEPTLDQSYAERVAYRIKKWAGINVTPPPRSDAQSKRPHHSELCEGCKAGHCRESDLITAMGSLNIHA